MTRRVLLAEIGKLSGVLLGAVGLMSGCGGDSGSSTATSVELSPERKAQIAAEQKATQDYYAKKKK